MRGRSARCGVLAQGLQLAGPSSVSRCLVGVGKASKNDDFCLFDIKGSRGRRRARISVEQECAGQREARVQGALQLSPYLGERMKAAGF